MSPLHKALQSWKGPESILTTLRQAGYGAHSVYRDCILKFCESGCFPTDLDMYWEETAKEYISSAGAVFDLGKCRRLKGYYRSPYLDRLQLEAQKFTSKFETLPSVHPCIHGYMSEKAFGDKSLYPKIRKRVEEKKSAECIEKDISAASWTGLKRELTRISHTGLD